MRRSCLTRALAGCVGHGLSRADIAIEVFNNVLVLTLDHRSRRGVVHRHDYAHRLGSVEGVVLILNCDCLQHIILRRLLVLNRLT